MPRDQVNEVELLRADDGASWRTAEAPTVNLLDTVLSNLTAARELLSNKKRWTKGTYCSAGAYCLYGAIAHVGYRDIAAAEAGPEAELLERLQGERWLSRFNDAPTTTHADVLALFDRAISSRKGG